MVLTLHIKSGELALAPFFVVWGEGGWRERAYRVANEVNKVSYLAERRYFGVILRFTLGYFRIILGFISNFRAHRSKVLSFDWRSWS